MHKRSQLLLVVLGAAAVMAAAVSTASATRLASNSNTIRSTWAAMEFIAEGVTTVRCPVTLEGTLHSRTISKVAGQLIGFIKVATVAEASCQNGKARVLSEKLPWHVRYESFGGTLPNISSINTQVIGAAFLVQTRVFGVEVSCLYTTSTTEPNIGKFNREAGGVVTSVDVSGSIRSPTFGCPRGTLGGNGTVKTAEGANYTTTLVA
jgi:hypothetical protein